MPRAITRPWRAATALCKKSVVGRLLVGAGTGLVASAGIIAVGEVTVPVQPVGAHLRALDRPHAPKPSSSTSSTSSTTAGPSGLTTTTTTTTPTTDTTTATAATTDVSAGASSVPAYGHATASGCDAALAYLRSYAAPGFALVCPGPAGGGAALTCYGQSPCQPGQKMIVIAEPCPAAYMNEAHNSWVLKHEVEGTPIPGGDPAIDPYGPC